MSLGKIKNSGHYKWLKKELKIWGFIYLGILGVFLPLALVMHLNNNESILVLSVLIIGVFGLFFIPFIIYFSYKLIKVVKDEASYELITGDVIHIHRRRSRYGRAYYLTVVLNIENMINEEHVIEVRVYEKKASLTYEVGSTVEVLYNDVNDSVIISDVINNNKVIQ